MYNFGKWIELMEQATEYGGRTLKQRPDYGFEISMGRYLRDKAREIRLERGRMKDSEALATPAEITAMRGVVGKLNWASREGMPQGCGDCSMLVSCFPKPKVADLLEMNALYRRLKKDAVVITIHAIPLNRLRALVFSDASLGNNADCSTQVFYLACCCDASILDGAEAQVSVIAYKSHKMRRSASNVLYIQKALR